MEANRIVLHKITIKKAKKFENRSVIYEKDLENMESEITIEHNLSNDAILDDISLETKQDVISIFPKTMAGDGEHQIDDLKEHKKCELSITILEEEENKCKDSISNPSTCNTPQFDLSMFESSPCPTVHSNFSLPLQNSFTLFETDSSVQDIKYDKLQEESNTSGKDWCGEWENLLSDYSAESDISLLNYPVSTCNTDSVEENRPITIPKYFDNSSVKTDCSKKSDTTQKSMQSISTEKNLMEQLRKSLENSTNCLLKYLEKLESKNLKRKKSNLERNDLILESNTSVCKCNGKTVDKKREVNILNGSSAKSYILKDSTTSVANSTLKEEYLIQIDKSKNMELSNTEHSECGCKCCNGKCLHFERVEKNSNDSALKEAKILKKKAKATVSEIVNVSDKFSMPNIELKKYQSGFDLKKQNILPFVDIPKLFEKEPNSEPHGDGFQNKLVQTSYPAAGDFLCENGIPLAKESIQNVFKQRKNKEFGKRNAESRLLTVPDTNNDNEDGDEKIEDKEENQNDTIAMMYLAIILTVPVLLIFHFFILICT